MDNDMSEDDSFDWNEFGRKMDSLLGHHNDVKAVVEEILLNLTVVEEYIKHMPRFELAGQVIDDIMKRK